MTDHYILISESIVGVHAKKSSAKEVYKTFAITFPVSSAKTLSGDYEISIPITKEREAKGSLRRKYEEIIEIHNGSKSDSSFRSSHILIGHDSDKNGNLMATTIRKTLLAMGVPDDDLVRIPLTEWGYIGIQCFIEEKKIPGYLEYKSLDKKFIAHQKPATNKAAGLIKQASLKYAYQFSGKKIEGIFEQEHIDSKGTSTATTTVKFMEE